MNNYIIDYEIATSIFVIMILIAYNLKNWIYMAQNIIFNILLIVSFALTVFDLFAHSGIETNNQFITDLISFSNIISLLGMVLISILFITYFLAFTGNINVVYDKYFLLTLIPAFFADLIIIVNSFKKSDSNLNSIQQFQELKPEQYIQYFQSQRNMTFIVLNIIIIGYIVANIIFIVRQRKTMIIKEMVLIISMSVVQIMAVILRNFQIEGNVLAYYAIIDLIVLATYIFLHSDDTYNEKKSRCFSDVGFKKFITEKEKYQENFTCLIIDIKNYKNISAICSENEMSNILKSIGDVMKGVGGRHTQFHIHTAEFVMIKRYRDNIEGLFAYLCTQMPANIRINGKNILIEYTYYELDFKEADYNSHKLLKLITSIGKHINEYSARDELVKFDGELRDIVEKEINLAHMLKGAVTNRYADLRFLPIASNKTGRIEDIEILIYLPDKDGNMIPNEEIYDAAVLSGDVNAYGRLLLESALKFAHNEDIFNKGIKRIHINIGSSSVGSDAVVEDYMEMILRYNIPPQAIVFELTDDMRVPMPVLIKHMTALKDFGISIWLDHYGINVFNLKNIMNIPFDTVKISHNLTIAYCMDNSHMLEYQIKMLSDAGLKIAVDGVDSQEFIDELKKFDILYLQGYYYSSPMAIEKFRRYLKEQNAVPNRREAD